MALPKLSAHQPIAGSLPPTRQFLEFMERTRTATENADRDLQDLIDQLAEQLRLINETRAVADAALSAATNNAGAKVAELSAAPGASAAEQVVSAVPEAPYLELSGALSGGALDANVDWIGTATLSESDGVTSRDVAVMPITVSPTGEVLPGPAWVAGGSSPITFSGFSSLSGTVTYTLSVTRTGGSSFVEGAAIEATLKITPGVV